MFLLVFFFKQKTAYEMRISDWSSDVCSSDLFARTEDDLATAQEMLADPDMKAMAEDEIKTGRERLEGLESELQLLLLPRDPNDGRSLFLEIRAGTGGDESALFSGDLLRMYSRYAEQRG